MNEEFTQDSLVAPTVLSLKHFGGVSAKLEVPVAVSEVSISLRSRSVSDALPIIALAVGNGTTTHSVLRGETISRDYEATKPLAIGAGRYDVIIEYSYATDSEQRPALDIHQLEFR